MLDVKVKDWTQKDRQTNKVLALSLWNGRISIQVYDAQNMTNKSFRRNMSEEELVLFGKMVNKIVGSSPETKLSCQFQKYDPQSKQFRIESVIGIEKDSKMCYRIHVTDCTKNQSFAFLLRASATMTMGSEPLKDDNLSAIKLETLKDWITNARIWGPATVQPIDRSKFGGNRNGGGNYNNQQAAPAAPAADSDNLPF